MQSKATIDDDWACLYRQDRHTTYHYYLLTVDLFNYFQIEKLIIFFTTMWYGHNQPESLTPGISY